MKRREFLQLTGVSALALAAGNSMAFAADSSALTAASGQTVFFRGWAYKTDIVAAFVKQYNTEMKGKVDYGTITGDYPALIEQALIAKNDIDIFYANPSIASRFMEAGWVMPADELPDVEEIKADIYPNLLEAFSHKGQFMGLPYMATTRGVLHVNLKAYKEAGMTEADFPQSWDELYDQVHALAAKGVKQPFLPHWFGEYFGMAWGFVLEMLNRGGQIADAQTHAPAMTTDENGPAYKTLAAWKKLWKSGLVPEEVLTYNEAGFMEAYASGRYVFSTQGIWDLKTFNDPTRSQIAGFATLVPIVPEKQKTWGVIDSGMYVMSSRERAPEVTEDVKRFDSWYGYKNQKGEIAVAKSWLDELVFTPYKSVMESPETEKKIKALIARPEDYKVILDVFQATPYPTGNWKVIWASEFDAWLKENLNKFLLEDGDIVEFIEAANSTITEMNSKYGI